MDLESVLLVDIFMISHVSHYHGWSHKLLSVIIRNLKTELVLDTKHKLEKLAS